MDLAASQRAGMRAQRQIDADIIERVARALLEAADPRRSHDGAARRLLERALAAATESERKVMHQQGEIERLRALSLTDETTGLSNRRGFHEALDKALSRARRHGETGVLIVVDLDGFKAINDTYGHSAGDYVLQAVASLLQQSVRRTDDVARIGGDEFAVLLNQTTWREGHLRADGLERMLNGLIAPWRGGDIEVRASVGVEPYGPDDDPERLYEAADRKMYAAKHGPRERSAA